MRQKSYNTLWLHHDKYYLQAFSLVLPISHCTPLPLVKHSKEAGCWMHLRQESSFPATPCLSPYLRAVQLWTQPTRGATSPQQWTLELHECGKVIYCQKRELRVSATVKGKRPIESFGNLSRTHLILSFTGNANDLQGRRFATLIFTMFRSDCRGLKG